MELQIQQQTAEDNHNRAVELENTVSALREQAIANDESIQQLQGQLKDKAAAEGDQVKQLELKLESAQTQIQQAHQDANSRLAAVVAEH